MEAEGRWASDVRRQSRRCGYRASGVGAGRQALDYRLGLGVGPLRRQSRECSRGSSAAGPWRQGREGRAVGAEPQGEGAPGIGRQAPAPGVRR